VELFTTSPCQVSRLDGLRDKFSLWSHLSLARIGGGGIGPTATGMMMLPLIELLAAVTSTPKKPGVAPDDTNTSSCAVYDPFRGREKLAGLKLADKPTGLKGVNCKLTKLTWPEELWILVRFRVTIAVDPWRRFRDEGLAEIVKSGPVATMVTLTDRDVVALEPVKVTVYVPGGVP